MREIEKKWTAENESKLGTIPDHLLGLLLRLPTAEVRARREARGIPKFDGRHHTMHERTPRDVALLGTMQDAAVARELGIRRQNTSGTVKGGFVPRTEDEFWTQEALTRLGQISDSLLASNLRIHSSAVRAKREGLGIPRYAMKHTYTREWTPEEIALLGTMSDADIAKKLGISRAPVAVRRMKMGIPRQYANRKSPDR